MTRPAALTLLCILLALTACSYVGVPLGSPTPRDTVRQNGAGAPLATPIALDATNDAILMGENRKTPVYTPTSDKLATQAAANLAVTIEARDFGRVAATTTQSVYMTQAAYVAQTQAAQAPAQSATARYQSTANALAVLRITEQADVWTATAAAPAVAATSAYLVERTKYTKFLVLAEPSGMFFGGFALLVLSFCFVAVLRRKPAGNQPEVEDEPEPQREHWLPEKTGADLISIPVNVATGKQLRVVADGLARGLPLSHGNFTPSEKGFSELGWRAFTDYCVDHKPALMTERNPGLRNTAVDPSDKLKAYLRNFETRPAPPQARHIKDTGILPVDRQTDTPTDTQDGAGEGATDPFGILPNDKNGDEK